ncbi:MAG: anthranilate phosphoribosyltransferase [Elusimicrobia bacterium]|nr:anthranilate phosphoribosyltransferase [Elusimicrobiota bacterium]
MTGGFKRFLDKALSGEPLGRAGAREAMGFLISGELEPAQIAGFLKAVGPGQLGAGELAGFAETMRAHAVSLSIDRRPLVDTCGTGGDGLGTFNFSTAAALVVAGAGVAVAKHGNRAVSSRSGSADVLEALGIAVDLEPEATRESIEQDGFGFLFAQRYHPAMRHVAPVRKALGIRTVFNLLGPLANPAPVKRQVIGLYDRNLMEIYTETLLLLGAERVMVVRGEDGMDEFTLTGATLVCHGDQAGGVRTERITPEDAGLKRAEPGSLTGGDAAANAGTLIAVLEGAEGPIPDGTCFNAAAALLVAGTVSTLKDGVAAARESISSGRARAVLEKLRRRGKRSAS